MEIWKEIVGYEGLYEISNLGRVKSLARKTGRRSFNEVIRKPKLWSMHNGKWTYHLIILCKARKKSTKKIHRLVAEAFIPNPENKPEVHHIDFDTTNNRVENLKWTTHHENSLHSVGRYASGTRNGQSRFNVEDIRFIKQSQGNIGARNLAKIYGVCPWTIYHIWKGHTYKNVG